MVLHREGIYKIFEIFVDDDSVLYCGSVGGGLEKGEVCLVLGLELVYFAVGQQVGLVADVQQHASVGFE